MMTRNTLFDLLRSDIILSATTKIERGIRREILICAYKAFGNYRNFKFLQDDVTMMKQTVELCIKLINSSVITYENCPKQLLRGLSTSISEAYCNDRVIEVMIFASYAVGKGKIIDPTLLLERKQYLVFNPLGELLQRMFRDYGINCRVNVILPDLHHEFSSLEYNSAWEANKMIIQNLTIYSVGRLSMEMDYATIPFDSLKGRERTMRVTDKSVLIQFGASAEKAISSIEYYSSIGKWLEGKGRNFIIADVQKKIYPYQQPFYNACRNIPIGVIPYQNLLQDPF